MTDTFTFPILSVIIFVPIIAAVVMLFIDGSRRDLIRGISITAAVIVLALSATVYFGYNSQVDSVTLNQDTVSEAGGVGMATQLFTDGLRYEENIPWISSLGISYHLGVDGLNAPMVLLTGMVTVAGVLISWRIDDRTREFMAFFMLLVAGVYGVFVSIDTFVLFFFYELAIFPMYLLIATWGWVKLRQYAAMKLTLYILIGSVIALVGVIAMVFTADAFFKGDGAQVFEAAKQSGILPADAGTFSFDMPHLMLAGEAGAYSIPGFAGVDALTFAKVWFPFIFIGFGVLAGVFPFHNWSPDGHVAAPTAVSMIHAGVLMKLGAYAALRMGVQLLPDGAQVHLPWIVFLTLINVVYGAFIAFRQRDFKYVIGFSSVSHMGLVSMGWASMNIIGMTGAGLQMFSHGAMTALFFGCVGMVYDRAHTRDIPSLGGFVKRMPWVAVAFVIGGLTSMGMPGLSGFIAEFPIFQGMWAASENISLSIGNFTLTNYYSVIVVIAALGIVITAAYVLRVTSQVFFGNFKEDLYPEVGDIAITDRIILILLGTPLIILGIYPTIMAPMLQSGLKPVLALLGGG
ncbi:MAG: NADH-quinone oxidoreductase subunit M [Anaerolineaceae bacterium]|nr:NADH-quinone oxidoreductase subunit M [Anaerolineaceae bacterium]